MTNTNETSNKQDVKQLVKELREFARKQKEDLEREGYGVTLDIEAYTEFLLRETLGLDEYTETPAGALEA